MKKYILLYAFVLLTLIACTENKGDMHLNDKESFTAVVKNVNLNSIMVSVNKDQNEYKICDVLKISLDYDNKDSTVKFNTGDQVRIYYNGIILASYPGQITGVYGIIKLK